MATDSNRCSNCGTALPPDATEPLCSRCGIAPLQAGETVDLISARPLADFRSVNQGVTLSHGSGLIPGQTSVDPTEDRTVDRINATVAMDGVPRPEREDPTQTADGRNLGASRPGIVRYFGDYELIEEVGEGGMGVVYKARQISLNRFVAVKMLKSNVLASEQELRRFQNEAEALALLDHPNIVPILEVGEDHGSHYFSMKLINGLSLEKRIPDFVSHPKDAARLMITVVEAVQHAHQRGILHRDLKPANILLDELDQPHVTDFGLAKRVEGDVEMTQSGAILGTPAYMSPEQANGRRGSITTSTDVYGLGAVLYALLTGKAPFGGYSMIETLDAVRHRPPETPKKFNLHVSRDLETICLKCLEKDPRRRYTSTHELATDLTRWLESRPIMSRRVSGAQRGWLWCKRKPIVAALMAAVALSTIGGTTSVIAVQSKANLLLEKKNVDLLNLTLTIRASRDRVQDLLKQSEIRAADLALDRALALSGEGRVPEGLLWMNRALELLPGDEKERRRVVLMNLKLWGAELRPLRERLDHQNRVVAVVFRPGDGRRVLTASYDGTARIWESETGSPVGSPILHADFVLAGAFHPNGRTVATAGRDRTARLSDSETGSPVGVVMEHEDWVNTLAFSPDGTRIATGCRNGMVRLWDAVTGKPLSPPMNHRAEVDRLIFSPEGRYVLTIGRAIARLWDASTGLETGKTFEDPTYLLCAAFSPDGRTLATGGVDKTVHLWDLETGKAVGPVLSHPDYVSVLTFSPDGQTLATGGRDQVIRVWDQSTRKLRWSGAGHRAIASGLAFSADGLTLASSSQDGTARLWNAADGQALGQPMGHGDALLTLAFSPDGRSLATAGLDRSARLWDISPALDRSITVRHEKTVENAIFSPDGQILATASSDGTARLWNARNGAAVCPPLRHADIVHLVLFRPDGKRVVTGGYDRTVRIWDVPSGTPVGKPMEHAGSVLALAMSPDGRSLATGGQDKSARLWNAETGEPLGPPIPHPAGLKDIAFRPDGKAFATVCDDKKARLWSFPSGTLIGKPMEHEAGVYTLAFDPTGQRLATGGDDKIARIWDASTALPLTLPLQHLGKIRWLAFSPDGQVLASASVDRTARLWNALTGEPMGPPLEHQDFVLKIAFSPDGKTLATASQGYSARLWDVAGARPLNPALKERDWVVSAAFSPDGRSLATACRLGSAHVIPLAEPLADEPERIVPWLSVLTEMEIGPGNAPRPLSSESWRARRRLLNEVGGAPPR